MRARSWWIDAGRLHGTLAAAHTAAKPTVILPFVPAACVDDATGKYYISSSGALYQLGATATQEAASAPPARAAREEKGLEEAAPGANPYSALELDVADEGNGLAEIEGLLSDADASTGRRYVVNIRACCVCCVAFV